MAEVGESSDLSFRLSDWGREKNPDTARPLHLEEAFDIIDMGAYDGSGYCHEGSTEDGVTSRLVSVPQFTVSRFNVKAPFKVSTEHSGSYLIYICTEGEADIQVPASAGDGKESMQSVRLRKGETVLVPADMQEFYIVPVDRDTTLLEAMTETAEEVDPYINPDTEPYLEGEDYGGVEDEEEGGK